MYTKQNPMRLLAIMSILMAAIVPSVHAQSGETVQLGITSLVCKNYEAASFIDYNGSAPAECTQATGDVFTLYLYGDGTDDHVSVTTVANSPAFVELAPGTYQIIHEATQMSTDLELVSGEYSIAFTLPLQEDAGNAPNETTPTPVPDSSQSQVTSLPETGTGSSRNMGMLLALTSTGVVLAAIGGGAVRRR